MRVFLSRIGVDSLMILPWRLKLVGTGPPEGGPSSGSRTIRKPRRLEYGDQLNVEYQHAFGGAGASLIGEGLRNPEAGGLAFFHQRDALGPAGDHAVKRELGGLAAVDRAVEFRAVGGPAGIVYAHGIARA